MEKYDDRAWENLVVWPSDLDRDKAEEVVSHLLLNSMKHNYCELMKIHSETKRVSLGMFRLFGSNWTKSKERIWQWYDLEIGDQSN